MHTLTTRVRLELPHLASVRRRVLAAGASVAVSDADAERLRGLFGLRAMLKRGDVTITPGKPDDVVMRVVRVDGQELPPAPVDPVERAMCAIEYAEALMAGLSVEERDRLDRLMEERYRSRLAEGEGEGDGAGNGEVEGTDSSGAPDEGDPDGGDATEPQPTTPPSPSEGAAGATPPADPADTWGLASRDREGLRALARELGLAEKVDLRLGEERLREALGAAIAASLGAEG